MSDDRAVKTARKRWTRLASDLGVTDGDAWDRCIAELLELYSQPERHYHNLHHVEVCLRHLDALKSTQSLPPEAELALWFHDAIYDTRRDDNEQRSAELAATRLQTLAASADVERVRTLILATRHDGVHSSRDAQSICDIDLAILGASPTDYDDYSRQIRKEYEWVPLTAYCRGRTQVLEQFAQRTSIFQTPEFAALEQRARENLARELQALQLEKPGTA